MGDLCLFYRRNLHIAAAFCVLLYAGAAYAQSLKGLNEITTPVFGASLTTLAMALTGTLIGFAHIDPISTRRRLYSLILSNTVLASWLSVLVPHWQEWNIPPALVPPFTGVFATVTVVLTPILVKRASEIVGRFLDKWFGKNEQASGGNG